MEAYLPFEDSIRQAINDWNWVLNPKNDGEGVDFFFYQVSGESAQKYGDIRFIYRDRPYEPYVGLTDFYYAHQMIEPDDGDYEFTVITINEHWTPTHNYFQEMRKILNHEIGHAVGLAHNPEDNGTIMYPTWNNCTAYVPTLDDITGVRVKYS